MYFRGVPHSLVGEAVNFMRSAAFVTSPRLYFYMLHSFSSTVHVTDVHYELEKVKELQRWLKEKQLRYCVCVCVRVRAHNDNGGRWEGTNNSNALFVCILL